MSTLRDLYKSELGAFSTINFTKGTEKPLYTDYFHFDSMPELMLTGVWVAFEDTGPDAGTLWLIPGSKNSPII